MQWELLARGGLLGFAIAAPVGPIGLLCIQRTLAQGRRYGLASGLGAATADALYGSVAAFGLTLASSFLLAQRPWLALAGGLFLCYLGVRTFLAAGPGQAAAARSGNLGGAYLSTFALTLTNPMTILAFVAIFSGLGLAAQSDYGAAGLTVVGVFLGSAAWWLLLSGAVGLLQGWLGPGLLGWVNRLAGVVITVFGAAALWGALP